MSKNIKCDVVACSHNANGCNCKLDSIKVCCGKDGGNCTCCGSFDCKE